MLVGQDRQFQQACHIWTYVGGKRGRVSEATRPVGGQDGVPARTSYMGISGRWRSFIYHFIYHAHSARQDKEFQQTCFIGHASVDMLVVRRENKCSVHKHNWDGREWHLPPISKSSFDNRIFFLTDNYCRSPKQGPSHANVGRQHLQCHWCVQWRGQ